MGTGNVIGPYVVMRGDITIGNNNVIGSAAGIKNKVTIGDNNRIFSQTSIGAVGEMGLKGDRLLPDGQVVIGNHVTIREFVCVHSPVYQQETIIGDHSYLMNKSYVAHDCILGESCVLSAGALLGGRVVLEEGVTIGLGASVHQRCHIGAYAMIGMLTPVVRDILPFSTVAGSPARLHGLNRVGAERVETDPSVLDELETFFNEEIHPGLQSTHSLISRVLEFLRQYPEALLHRKESVL
jgi:UDP-N-acetylglucosamine acyltransferase